jgi:hypothetical protein
VLDRMMRPSTPLDEAAKCALVSMDSTMKSNLSVGLPLDLVVYEAGALQSSQIVCIDDKNPYFQMIRNSWGEKLRQVFESIDDPQWDGAGAALGAAVRAVGPLRADEEDPHARGEGRLGLQLQACRRARVCHDGAGCPAPPRPLSDIAFHRSARRR